MSSKDTKPLLEVQAAQLEGHAAQMREADRPGHRPVGRATGGGAAPVAAGLRLRPRPTRHEVLSLVVVHQAAQPIHLELQVGL